MQCIICLCFVTCKLKFQLQTLMKYAIKLKWIERIHEAKSPGMCNNCNFICFTPNREGEKAHRANMWTNGTTFSLLEVRHCWTSYYPPRHLFASLSSFSLLIFQSHQFIKSTVAVASRTVTNYSPAKRFTLWNSFSEEFAAQLLCCTVWVQATSRQRCNDEEIFFTQCQIPRASFVSFLCCSIIRRLERFTKHFSSGKWVVKAVRSISHWICCCWSPQLTEIESYWSLNKLRKTSWCCFL